MTHSDAGQPLDQRVRETYEEVTVAGRLVARIADPETDTAWIQSDDPVPIEP